MGIGYKAVPFEEGVERTFEDMDTIYYPVFRVFPLGRKTDLAYTLIRFELSKKDAFSGFGKGILKK